MRYSQALGRGASPHLISPAVATGAVAAAASGVTGEVDASCERVAPEKQGVAGTDALRLPQRRKLALQRGQAWVDG